MNVKQWLRYYPHIANMKKELHRELSYIKSNEYVSVSAQVITGMPHSGKVSSIVENTSERREKEIDEIINKLNDLEKEESKINKALTKLTDLQRQIIELRYFQFTSWVKITEMIKPKLSEKTLYRHHNNAIKIIQEVFDNENLKNVG